MAERPRRIGLVLGAGGVAGGAFHAGVLAALEEATGWDPRTASVVVGTSAGSVTGASLRAGLPAADLYARAHDRPLSAEGRRVLRNVGPVGRPPLRAERTPRPAAQLAATVARAAARPLAARPWSLMAALLPEGSVSTDMIAEGIGNLFADGWPADPLWVCAVRQHDGRRVVFGRGGLCPPVPEAVASSCAIPGYFQPVMVDGAPHIDGGVHSPTNADLLLDDDDPFDLVLVSSPMSRRGRRPRLALDQAMRGWSGALLDAEARRLRRRGPLVAFQPDESVLSVIGLDPMDPSRRSAIADAARESTLRRLERSDLRQRLELLLW